MKSTHEGTEPKFRQCGFCGRMSPIHLVECPHCHETLPEMPRPRQAHTEDHGELRRGLLYLTLAGVIHYFAGGYSSMELPVQVPPLITLYLTPALFVLGLGFVGYGMVIRLSK